VQDIALATDGTIFTAGRDGAIKLWKPNGQLHRELDPATDEVTKVAVLPNGKGVVSGDWAGQVRLWPTDNATPKLLPLPIKSDTTKLVAIQVPVPDLPPVPSVADPILPPTPISSTADLDRMRTALKAIEDAAHKMKHEAARNPQNPALAKAYLQLCEAALTMETELLAAEKK
jgi:WD40 repeat protein